jgi:hypothetical protein
MSALLEKNAPCINCKFDKRCKAQAIKKPLTRLLLQYNSYFGISCIAIVEQVVPLICLLLFRQCTKHVTTEKENVCNE